MRSRSLVGMLVLAAATASVTASAFETEPQRRRAPRGYHAVPTPYHFTPIPRVRAFYYHPYFGFYYGPYYGPFYPYPGPYFGPVRYSTSAVRTRVKPVETEVYVNGYYAGTVDDFDGVFQRLYLPYGQHEIELRLDGYRSFRQKVYLSPNDTFEIRHDMEPLGAGDVMDVPPQPRKLPEEWLEAQEEITEEEEQPLNILDRPASPYSVLTVSVQPENVELFIDGELWSVVGALPQLVLHVPAGKHRIEIRKKGYKTFAVEVELQEGQVSPLNVKLAPESPTP